MSCDTGWALERDGVSFSISCSCGACVSSGPRVVTVMTGAQRGQVERAVWAAFIHQARRGRCAECLSAAGRWLRGEPLFTSVKKTRSVPPAAPVTSERVA
jgi:hypothetical protein